MLISVFCTYFMYYVLPFGVIKNNNNSNIIVNFIVVIFLLLGRIAAILSEGGLPARQAILQLQLRALSVTFFTSASKRQPSAQ